MQKPFAIQKYFGPTYRPTDRPTQQGVESRVCDKKWKEEVEVQVVQSSFLTYGDVICLICVVRLQMRHFRVRKLLCNKNSTP